MPPFFLRPVGILAAFGAILLALGLFTWFDAGRRTALEETVLASALGDDHYFVASAGALQGTEAVRGPLGPWLLAEPSAQEFPEADLLPDGLGEADGKTYVLYRHAQAGPDTPASRLRYLKIAPGRFLAVTSPPAETPPP